MQVSYRFDHVHLNAQDLEATVTFYERVFGMHRVRTFETDGKPSMIQLEAGGARMAISAIPPIAGGRGNAVDHFALSVSDITAAVEALQAHGVPVVGELAMVGAFTRLFVQAPDGVVIEIMSPSSA